MDPVIAETLAELSSLALAQGNLLRLHVRGTSMAPFFQPGDVVTARAATVDALSCGDLAVVRSAAGLVIHRWLYRGDGRCWLWGDRLAEPDPPVTAEAIIARAVAFERDGRRRDLERWRWRATNRMLGKAARLLAGADINAHRHNREKHEPPAETQSLLSLRRGATRILAAAYRVLVAALIWSSRE